MSGPDMASLIKVELCEAPNMGASGWQELGFSVRSWETYSMALARRIKASYRVIDASVSLTHVDAGGSFRVLHGSGRVIASGVWRQA